MDMERMVGKRLYVMDKKGLNLISWGTYIWDEEILLDGIGKKIHTNDCHWEELVNPPEAPPFGVTLVENTRVFFDETSLLNRGELLPKGRDLWITKLGKMPWNHGGYLAGQFCNPQGEYRWVLISELHLKSYKTAHLRVVK